MSPVCSLPVPAPRVSPVPSHVPRLQDGSSYLWSPGRAGGGRLRGLGAWGRLGGARGAAAAGPLRGQPVIAAVLLEGESVGLPGKAALGACGGTGAMVRACGDGLSLVRASAAPTAPCPAVGGDNTGGSDTTGAGGEQGARAMDRAAWDRERGGG